MQHSRIQDELWERHWPAFRRLMLKPSLTIDQAQDWLAKRGCVASRSAVGRYLKRRRSDPMMAIRQELLGNATDATLRWKLSEMASELSGSHLAQLVIVAGHLRSVQGSDRVACESERKLRKAR